MSTISIEALFILLLILLNGVLAMSEMALVSSRKVRLQQRAELGDKGAAAALALADNPNRFLSTVQVGITLIGILAGAFSGATIAEQLATRLESIEWIARYSEAVSVALVVLVVTYLSLIFGELVPKRLAMNNAERLASLIARPMRIISLLGAPAVRLLSFSTEAVLKLLRVRPSIEPPITEDEIKMMIRQGTQLGIFEEAEQDIVENVFRMADRRVSALMTPRTEIVWLDTEDPAEVNRMIVADSPHSRFPVCRGDIDRVIGVVRAKDLLADQLAGKPFDPESVLRPPVLVPESISALKALEVFKQTGRHVALVVDEHGGIEGLITHHDILEGMVGDIPLTGEMIEAQAVQREDGSWLLDGSLLIDEFKELFRVRKMPGEDTASYQTLSGFVMMYLGRVPSVGETFKWNGLRFEVLDMDGRRVDKVLVSHKSEK